MSVPESTTGWIAVDRPVERVELDPTSWVDVVRGFLPGSEVVHDELVASVAWEQGRGLPLRAVDRRAPAGVVAGRSPTASGAGRGRDLDQPPVPRPVRRRGAGCTTATSATASAFHRDRELRWLDDTVIGVLTPRRPPALAPSRPHREPPPRGGRRHGRRHRPGARRSGDLLVMGGRCQAAWLHAVPKVRVRTASRVSAQWRWTSRSRTPRQQPVLLRTSPLHRLSDLAMAAWAAPT